MVGKRTLIRGAAIVPCDPAIGVIREGDVLVNDGRIEAVGSYLAVTDAELIDAAGMIAMPGLVDGHKHPWQTIFRGTSGHSTLAGFFGEAVPAPAPVMTPDDVYASNPLGAIDAIAAAI